MKALIVTGGSLTDCDIINKYLKSSCLVIGADSGASYLMKNNVMPDILVGDFDSIEPSYLEQFKTKNVKVVSFPVEKDFTDTQLAVKYALEEGATSITILGGLGYRIDHSIANIYLLLDIASKNAKGLIENDFCRVELSTGYLEVDGNIGDTISLLPISDTVEGIHIEGFRYPIINGSMSKYHPYGVSNILVNCKGIIKHNSGTIAVIYAKKL